MVTPPLPTPGLASELSTSDQATDTRHNRRDALEPTRNRRQQLREAPSKCCPQAKRLCPPSEQYGFTHRVVRRNYLYSGTYVVNVTMGLLGGTDPGPCHFCRGKVTPDNGLHCDICDTYAHNDCMQKNGLVKNDSGIIRSSTKVKCPGCGDVSKV